MKAREYYLNLRQQKISFSLQARLTVLVGAEVLVSILISIGIAVLIEYFIPSVSKYPMLIQIGALCTCITVIATRLLSKLFFDPIKKLREGMQRVADGDFSVRLEDTRPSTAKETKELYAGFNMMMQELETTEILQTDFVSNVSHEFKTPINAIEGYATLLQDCEDTAEQQRYIDKIFFNTKRLSALVGNILLLSKLENQSIPQQKTKFRLDEQIRQSIVGLETAWDSKDTVFDVDLADTVYIGNEPLLRHVWDNLIGNAIKFGPHGGTVTLRLFQTSEQVIFTVSDEGPGLTEEALRHIYDKFYQADNSHEVEGNGLGLSLVRRILISVGGSVYAENLEKGCQFKVTLPK